MSTHTRDISKIGSWFNIKNRDARDWVDGNKSFESLLNLGSEDAVITHFIVPFFRSGLGYEVKEIDIKPYLTINYGRTVKRVGGESDVVIKKGSSPVIVIEAKSYGHRLQSPTEDAEGQAYDYTRANELRPIPKYYMTTNVQEIHIYETSTRKELDFSPISEAELLSKYEDLYGVISKEKITPIGAKIVTQHLIRTPITDQREFEKILYKCQDEMREASESKTGLIAFAEMNKLLFIKLYEDRREQDGYENRFTRIKISEEGDNYVRGTLFRDIKDHYEKRNLKIFRREDEILLDDITINKIVERLEKKFLVDEEGRVYPPVAHVYENFVSTIFRGENGQYFTPRKIVDFIVKLAQIKWGTEGKYVVDPCCGSGGFLLSAFQILNDDLMKRFIVEDSSYKYIFKNKKAEREFREAKTKLCEEMLIGFDNEEIIAKTSAMNMSVHGDGSTGINFGDSLQIRRFQDILKPSFFDFVLTNPPFSSQIKKGSHIDIDETDILTNYELAHKHKYNPTTNKFDYSMSDKDLRQQDSKVLFIEKCYSLLKPGGILGIIIDDGVVNNPRDSYIRDFIYRNFVIKSIVALPFDIFKEQDAHNYTSILLLQKKREGLIQGDVFMAITEHCGENIGKSTLIAHNDLDDVLEDYLKYDNEDKTDFSTFSFICKHENLLNYYNESSKKYENRLDPKYYFPRRREIEESIDKTENMRPIEEVVDFSQEIYPEENVNQFGSKYIERITNAGVVEFGIIDGTHDPKGKKDRIFKNGDLVVSRINLKSGMIAIIPEELDEISATSEYYKLEPKKEDGEDIVLKKYLYIVLTSKPIQYLLKAVCTGQYGRISDDKLGEISIPVPPIEKQKEIIDLYEKEISRLLALEKETEEKKNELSNQIEAIIFRASNEQA